MFTQNFEKIREPVQNLWLVNVTKSVSFLMKQQCRERNEVPVKEMETYRYPLPNRKKIFSNAANARITAIRTKTWKAAVTVAASMMMMMMMK
jgi:hypothetical protein